MGAESEVSLALPNRSTAKHSQHRPRFGLMVPWANTAVEAEVPLFLDGSASLHTTRLVPDSRTTALDHGFLSGLVLAVPAAWESLSRTDLHAVAFCCTSASIVDSDLTATLEANLAAIPIPTLTAYSAIVQNMKDLHVTRFNLITPYDKAIAEREALVFADDGFEVTYFTALGLTDGFDHVGPDALIAAAESNSRSEEAVVISCTGLYTATAIATIRDRLGRLCISSNSAIAHALQQRTALPIK